MRGYGVTVLTIINNSSLQCTFPYLVTLLFLKFCDIYLFPCFCPICVNLFLMSNVCLFPMYAHFIFLLAVVIAFVAFARICAAAPFYVFTCFLFCFHFYFVSSCLVVPQQDVQRFLVARCSKIFQCVL